MTEKEKLIGKDGTVYAVGKTLDLEVTKSQEYRNEISVEGVVEGEAMYLLLADMTGHRLNDACEKSVAKLLAKTFQGGDVKVWRVVDVYVPEKLQGRGYGKALYEQAFKAARPAIVVSGGCTGMGTSTSAFRVWKSLACRYEHEGSSPTNSAIAVY